MYLFNGSHVSWSKNISLRSCDTGCDTYTSTQNWGIPKAIQYHDGEFPNSKNIEVGNSQTRKYKVGNSPITHISAWGIPRQPRHKGGEFPYHKYISMGNSQTAKI
jgi:hypothetical protein